MPALLDRAHPATKARVDNHKPNNVSFEHLKRFRTSTHMPASSRAYSATELVYGELYEVGPQAQKGHSCI